MLALFLSCFSAVRAEESTIACTKTSDLVRIGKKTFGIDDEASDWNGGKGWRNDTENDYIVMVDFDGSNAPLVTSDVEVTLAMAGLNRLKKISAGNNVNIIGTGILLVDEIEMVEGAEISIQPDTNLYTEGSVAVFLKQSGNTYRMINRGVKGILDEEYTLPEGVDLVVPAGDELDMNTIVLITEEYADETGNIVTETTKIINRDLKEEDMNPRHEGGNIISTEVTSAQLTISSSSSLTIEQNASLNLHSSFTGTKTEKPKLTAEGTLNVSGPVDGGIINIPNGLLEGNGTIKNAEVYLKTAGSTSDQIKWNNDTLRITGAEEGTALNPIMEDTTVITGSTGIDLGNITSSGDSEIIYQDGTQTGSITCSSGNLLIAPADTIYNPVTLTVNDDITGSGTVTVGGGVVVLEENAEVSAPGLPSAVYDAVIHDKSGSLADSDFQAVVNSGNSAAADPVKFVYESITHSHTGKTTENIYAIDEGSTGIVEGGLAASESLTADQIIQKVFSDKTAMGYLVEVIRMDADGNMSVTTYSTENDNLDAEVDLSDACLVRAVEVNTFESGEGGSSNTSTNTDFTGSGMLGNNTGTMTGGDSTAIFSGTGRSDPGFDTDTGGSSSGSSAAQTSGSAAAAVSTPAAENTQTNTTQTVPAVKPQNIMSVIVTAEKDNQYLLSVYMNRTKLTTLNGTTVKAEVRYPAGVTDNSICYAVFNDNGQDIWVPAEYDAENNILSFETDQIGLFRIARVVVSDVNYPDYYMNIPVYRKLSLWIGNEEISDPDRYIKAAAPVSAGEKTGTGLYAVFADEDEQLYIFPAVYDEDSEKYLFESDETGSFVIVQPEGDFQPGSDELYQACLASDEVRTLLTIMRIYAFWR